MPDNKQHTNVGNPGDILKHAALVQLAGWFDVHARGSRAWLDTHCYLLESQLAYANWQQDVDQLVNRYPVYDAYRKLEQDHVAAGRYRCSSGLIVDLLPDIRLLLSEQNPETREVLQQQLVDTDINSVDLVNDMHDWQMRTDLPRCDALLALLDPFSLSEANWESACGAIKKILRPGGLGILEVFTYERVERLTTWPVAPEGWTGPVAVIDREPYHLAVYTTPLQREEVSHLLTVPGWLSYSDNSS